MIFGNRIKQLRNNAGMTQAELGKLIGVSDRVLGYYEANERFPRKQEVIAKFAEVFRIISELYFDAKKKNKGHKLNLPYVPSSNILGKI